MHDEAWAARPRVLDALLAGAPARLSVVRAPSGYGKSVLLAQAREHLGSDAALLVLSERHQSATRLRADIATLTRGLGPHGHLLLDDYDDVAESAEAREVLEDLILRDGVRVILATRTRPRLSLGRLRAMRALHEIGARELAFTAPELQEVATDVWGLAPESFDADALLRATHGWIAGAALTVDVLGGRAAGGRLEDGLWAVFEYLAEVADRQVAPDLLRFAISTSPLEYLDAEVCRQVTEDPRTTEHLETLIDDSIFTETVGQDRARHRFHPLFRAYLGDLLRRFRTPDEIAALHERAAVTLAAAGEPSRALIHLLRAGSPDRAAALLEETGIGQLGTASLAEVEELLTLQDGAAMREHPWLMALLGRLKRLRNDFDGALAALNAAALAFQERADVDGLAWTSSELSQVRYRDDAYSGSVSRVRGDLANESLAPITRANLSAHLCWLLCETGPVDEAISAGEVALSRGTVIDDAALRGRVLGRAHRNLALAALYSGNVDRALALVAQARLDCVDDEFELAWTNVIAAAAHATRGDLARAQELLAAIIGRTTPYASTQLRWAYWWMGNVLRAHGRMQDADSAYQMAGSLAAVDDTLLRRSRHGSGLLVAVAGRLSGAERASESVIRHAGTRLVEALAREESHRESSLHLLGEICRDLEESGHLLHAASIGAYRARSMAAAGRGRESQDQFDQIVGFMIHNRISVLPWGVTRQPDGPLEFADRPVEDISDFAAAIERCADPAIRERLTAAHRDLGLPSTVIRKLRARDLTWREVDVFVVYHLRSGPLLDDGSSLRHRTARTLGISEHTLKTHITRIRAKVSEVDSSDPALVWLQARVEHDDSPRPADLEDRPVPRHPDLQEDHAS